MDIRFSPHNTHLENPAAFDLLDPHLRQLQLRPLIHRSDLIDTLPTATPGIFTIGGSRQVGKTTLMKQWMAALLKAGVAPQRIRYVTGELIDDHHALVRLIADTLKDMPTSDMCYLVLDEVTYIREWDKGVKYLADAGMLESLGLFLTGSDLAIIREARMRFPGRRGSAPQVDFHLYPLSFHETVRLKHKFTSEETRALLNIEDDPAAELVATLYELFNEYLIHGGFLPAINDLAEKGSIPPATFFTYSDWIRGDVLKRGKQERYLQEIIEAVILRYGSQITWNALARTLSIDHPKTVSDYVDLLASMDAVFVQPALIEDKLSAAPKKARKVMFTDPFIFHALSAWLRPTEDPYRQQVLPLFEKPEWVARLVEATLVTHYRRLYPTFYIKAEGEVDVAYVSGNRFWPVEVKWTGQIRAKDIKQISKYPNGRILTKSNKPGNILGVPAEPLPLALFRLR